MRKYLVAGLIAAMLSGCASSSYYGGHVMGDAVRTEHRMVRHSAARAKHRSIDDLIKSVSARRQNGRKHVFYQGILDNIDKYVEDRKYDMVEKEVHSAVKALRNERFEGRERYIDAFINYSYIRTDLIAPQYAEEKRMYPGGVLAGILSAIPVVAFGVVDNVLSDGKQTKRELGKVKRMMYDKGRSRKVHDGYRIEYEVFPYSGKEVELRRYR